MKLSEFFEEVGGKESSIIVYVGAEALEAVKQDSDALQYVDKSILDVDGNTKKSNVCQYCGK